MVRFAPSDLQYAARNSTLKHCELRDGPRRAVSANPKSKEADDAAAEVPLLAPYPHAC